MFSLALFTLAMSVPAPLNGGESEVKQTSKAFIEWCRKEKVNRRTSRRQGADVLFVPEVVGTEPVNGWITEKTWKKTKAVPFICLDGTGDGIEAPTEAKLLTCRGVLYFRFECREPDIKHLVYGCTGRDAATVWRDDCLEIFLRPNGKRSAQGPHFIINPVGALYDANKRGNTAWDPPVRHRERIDEKKKRWTVELAMPLRALHPKGKIPLAWPANFIRCRQGRERACAEDTGWRATGTMGGNVPNRFGLLYFEAAEQNLWMPAGLGMAPSKAELPATLKSPEKLKDVLRGKYLCPAAVSSEVSSPPNLDGDPEDAAWKETDELKLVPLSGAIHPAEVEPTSARILHDQEKVYVFVRCVDRDMKSVREANPPGRKVSWREDSVEIHLSPGRKESHDYRQVMVNPVGSTYVGKGSRPTDRGDIEAKAKMHDEAWTVEVSVPYATWGLKKGEIPSLCGVNIIRNRPARSGTTAQCTAWSPPNSYTVHNPAKFGSVWMSGADVCPELGDDETLKQLAATGAAFRASRTRELPDNVAQATWDVFTPEQRQDMNMRSMVTRHLHRLQKEIFAERDKEWDAVKTWEDWLKLRGRLRENFWQSVGLPPKKRCDLNPRVSTVYENKWIKVQGVIFESRKRFYMTTNLFLPKRRNGKPVPAIIRVIGHGTRGRMSGNVFKFAEQAVAKGYAVLSVDSLGQGERIYVNNGHGSKTPTRNHYFQGAPCTLTASNLAGYMIYDIMRAIDYLETRSEIDMSRVVMTGSSGGGTLSSYVAALEDRLFGAAPVSAVGSARTAGGNYDSEQVLFGDTPGFFESEGRCAAVSPRPLRVISEYGKEERKKQNIEAFEVARKMYGLKGVPGKLEYFPTEEPHGYGRGHQRLFFQWVTKVMPPNPDTPKPLKEKADYSTKSAHASKSWRAFFSRELKDRETVFTLNKKRIRLDLAFDKGVSNEHEANVRCREITNALRELMVLEGLDFKPLSVEKRAAATFEGYAIEKLVLETDPDVFVPALLWRPKGNARPPAVVWMLGRGKRSLVKGRWKELREILDGGVAVLMPDLRGTGESAMDTDESFMGDDCSLNGFGYRLGRPVIGMRVRDALCCVEYLRSREDINGGRLGLIGDSLSESNPPHIRQPRLMTDQGLEVLHRAESIAPAVALLAFAMDEGILCCATRGALGSYASICERPYFFHPLAAFVPGVLRKCDVADICAASAPRSLLLAGSVNGHNQRIDTVGEGEKTFKRTVKGYEAAGNPKALKLKHDGGIRDVVAFVASQLGK